MTINILFYGNCQLFAVLKTLNLSSHCNPTLIECLKRNINTLNIELTKHTVQITNFNVFW
jgi:hypothetical protein